MKLYTEQTIDWSAPAGLTPELCVLLWHHGEPPGGWEGRRWVQENQLGDDYYPMAALLCQRPALKAVHLNYSQVEWKQRKGKILSHNTHQQKFITPHLALSTSMTPTMTHRQSQRRHTPWGQVSSGRPRKPQVGLKRCVDLLETCYRKALPRKGASPIHFHQVSMSISLVPSTGPDTVVAKVWIWLVSLKGPLGVTGMVPNGAWDAGEGWEFL